ncbi:hypothetical protein ACFP1Z_07720 [Streptomyces gamaensis]|uniref:Uncharacterized protein n=1 Tax=Streptomyces gamaensis TaxID=1763542 RepID=A0ABW0Z085_9ACTN
MSVPVPHSGGAAVIARSEVDSRTECGRPADVRDRAAVCRNWAAYART